MDIKSVNAPAIGQKGIDRLLAWARPKRMTADQTTFDMGYEQAKRDLLEVVYAEVGIPAENQISSKRAAEFRKEAAIAEARVAPTSLLSRMLSR